MKGKRYICKNRPVNRFVAERKVFARMKIEYIIEVAVIFGEKRNSGTKLDAYICTVNKMFHLKPVDLWTISKRLSC
ncbi:hypothetical protein DW990_00990 [Phocaeicola vulgatus]|nr:hypothetical protein DW990_00990 [Phocaeicola vulgatus]